MEASNPSPKAPEWYPGTKVFEQPVRWKAIVQLVNTLGPYAVLGALALFLLRSGVAAPWILPLGLAAGFLLVRVFILFHDCCHGSFWASDRVNRAWGFVLGVLAFTPFRGWRRSHGIHHAHNGNLDHRGTGDVWTMTLAEYRAASRGRRFLYRLYRHPLFLFTVAPPFNFLVLHRIPEPGTSRADRWGYHLTTAADLGLLAGAWALGGWDYLLWFVLPTVWVATSAGLWMFYVQHQFDPGYWEHQDEWDRFAAALRGSSFYRLPKWAQWLTGNIGFHHIHHLRPRIPNYRLEECFRAIPALQLTEPLTPAASLRGLFLHVWDEGSRRLLTFGQARRALKGAGASF